MLSQRILTRRLPQAARYALPRASFSQMRALRADETEYDFPVLSTSLIVDRQLTP